MFKRKGIPIELDKKRYLYLTPEGMVAFELATKKPIFVPATIGKLEPSEIITLVWCCLIHEGLSCSEVKRIIGGLNEDQWAELSRKLVLAWRDGRISIN